MNDVLELIISFVRAANKGNDKHKQIMEDGDCAIYNCKYLLNQILRQYEIPKENYHISKEAKELWESITDEYIDRFVYNETVKVKNDVEITRNFYSGANKEGVSSTIKKGDKFQFNSLFHCEHITPIATIQKQLFHLDDENELNEEKVKEILDRIHICRILKDEDKKLPRKREETFEENIEIYKEHGIELIGY